MKIVAIIPAFNEEKTVRKVIEAAQSSSFISEVVVVDDGSSDNTARIAQSAGARVIKSDENQGKAEAMERGVKATEAPFLMFIDADMTGLTSKHLDALIMPVISGKVEMTVGTVDRDKILFSRLTEKVESSFSGIRVLKRKFWDSIPKVYKKGYYIESAITYLARKENLPKRIIVLKGVGHRIKEEKYGWKFGTKARFKMLAQMALINLILRIH